MVTKWDFLGMESSLWLNEKSQMLLKVGCLPYMLGNSRPYPWLILEEMDAKLMMMRLKNLMYYLLSYLQELVNYVCYSSYM